MKLVIRVVLLSFLILALPGKAFPQDEMFKQKKERKRIWRKWRKDREAYNPYLKAKAKNKPSARMARGDRKELKRQKRAARRQMKQNKRAVNK